MGARHAARACCRGGELIQAFRQGDARVAAGAAAVAGAALLVLAERLAAADLPGVAGGLGFAGAAVLALGLAVRRGAAVTLGLALVGGGYAASLAGKGLDPAASLFAGALLLVAELAYWALEPGAAVRIGRAASARRGIHSLALSLGAVVLGALLLGVASAPAGGGVAMGIAGVAAIAIVFAAIAALLHGLRPRGRVR